MTDELNSYNGLVANGYKHEYVKHKESQFSFGDVCTNGIEGFWSHFRRMIIDCYHNVSDEHLQAYIDEACFRWNTRKASQVERFSDMFFMSIGLVRPNREFVLCENVVKTLQGPTPFYFHPHQDVYKNLLHHLE